MTRGRRILVRAIAATVSTGGLALICASLAPASGVVSAYTLVTPKSVSKTRLQVRAVIPSGVPCPRLNLVTKKGDKVTRKMRKRAPGATTGPAFASLRACQANVPGVRAGIRSARVGGVRVPHDLPPTYDEIVILGDTGCRVDDDEHQNCSKTTGTDPTDYWPLSRNSRAIAREEPDLTVFTGDFYYREAACPATAELQAKCGGSPAPVDGFLFKDTDHGWMADVFIPMAPLFRAAPMLAIRGNHEQCRRGGNGWFLFFEVTTELGPDACAPETIGGATTPNITPSWAFDARIRSGRTLRMVNVDSAYGQNFDLTDWVEQQRPKYVSAQRLGAPKPGRESWLLTHRPIFGIEPVGGTPPDRLQWTSIDQTAASQGLIGNFQMLLGSHVHVAQVVKIPGQPVQKIVGNGGSMPQGATDASSFTTPPFGPLATIDGEPLSPDYTPYPTASYDWTEVRYGYSIMKPRRKARQWTVIQRDYNGQTYATCTLTGRDMTCSE